MAQDVLFRYPEFCAAGCFVLSRQSLTLIFILATFYSSAWAAGDWAVLHETGSGNTCVLQSKPAPVYDGYQESIAMSFTMRTGPMLMPTRSRKRDSPC